MSRHSVQNQILYRSTVEAERHVHLIANAAIPVALSLIEISRAII